ncbi:MAG: hypothetical protein LBC51_05700 [Treponema sp.]|nr:hypothetical protein [Treponema sp.]
MAKQLGLGLALVFLALGCATNQRAFTDLGVIAPLDRAILNAAETIKADLEAGTVVAVLDFNSGNSRFDDYVMQELEIALVSGKQLAVTERKNIEQVRKEKLEQLRGDVSDETSASIGKEQGWKVVILGNLFDMKDTYRFRIRAVKVEEALIATAFAVDLSPKDPKVHNLLDGKKPPLIPLEAQAPQFQRQDHAKLVSLTMPRLSFAWDGEAAGLGVEAIDFRFSPLPYCSLGAGFWDAVFTFGDKLEGFVSFFPVHGGFLFPLSQRISATASGTLYWLGFVDEKEPLLNTGPHYTQDEEGNEKISYLGVFITPGIKAGLLFRLGDDLGLELSYKGYWFRERYLSTLGLGFAMYDLL